MEIKRLKLDNLGRFRSLEVDFAPTQSINSNVTVLIGNNGAGKTSILKALATSLSWLVARVHSDKAAGSPIPEEVILNGKPSAAISITLHNKIDYQWTLAKSRSGRKGEHISQLNDASKLADEYRTTLTNDEHSSLPLVAFYPVERVVLDIPLKIKEKHSFLQLDGYDNSLNQGVDFRRFFEWFREREDSENESAIPNEVLDHLKEVFEKNSNGVVWKELQKLNASAKDRQLTAVRSAISNFMPGFKDLKVRRKPRLHMSIDKQGETLNVLQLSQGEKSLMALVGDIARRLAMMNPALENPLHGDGVVLIDEVDMHLHPQWARNIIERLTTTFPNCQFVLTTHSPLVISDCKDVLVYALDNGEITQVPSQYGQDANTVLLDVMDTHIRNASVSKRLNELFDLIQGKKFDFARNMIAQLETELPQQNLELTKARLLLRKEELRSEKN
ncbi:AAA family ATPase [Undibacterium sp. 14-3-2]|uniref:AAA family ATPase n=1 Tax=Undibacterium sp. 14-3-2 TaxID=2800129 RepID=UPI001906337C|nr:AAA family ATPase [Undibacterium sp. 14-3-2]MBK1889322.1 AAA family ATPase [Undibacterium sp. 14-3-2]